MKNTMDDDLIATRVRIQEGRSSAVAELDHCLQAAAGPAAAGAFLKPDGSAARAAAESVDSLRRLGGVLPTLAGLAVSVKDLFDIAGQVTTAGSTVLADRPPAATDAPAVARLRAAGAALVGRTHMTEFAFSGIGLNPHHPTPVNVPWRALDAQPRIPGGSSSGAAVSVAAGAAWAALGSDTGGSIRIPAALQGLVGFKSTAALVPIQGALPLSPTLDTACAITRTVRDAILLHEVLAARAVALPGRPLVATRLAVPTTLMLDQLEPAIARAFDAALATLSRAGAHIVEIALPLLEEVATINAGGGFSAPEAWCWHRALLAVHESRYDPRVALRIRRGATMSAADYLDLQRARADWILRMHHAMRGFDALLSPTVPLMPPPIAELEASDEAFFAANGQMLRNPSVVNLLDGCALSLPCHSPGEAPVGLMLWARGGADDALLDTALAVEAALARVAQA